MPAWEDAPLVSPTGNTYGRLAPRKETAPQRPTELMAKYTLFSMAQYDLDELEDLLNKGGAPSRTDAILQGMASGTGLGVLASEAQSSQANRYYSVAGRIADSIEKAFTGAASSDLEHKRYITSNIPAYFEDVATQKSKINAMRTRLQALEALGSGTMPERGEAAPTAAPIGRMGPPATTAAPAAPQKQRLRYNPATGDLE